MSRDKTLALSALNIFRNIPQYLISIELLNNAFYILSLRPTAEFAS